MSAIIRLPNITAATDKGQLEQMRSYLYQVAEQLNWALSNVEQQATQAIQAATVPAKKDTAEQAQATFAEIKSLIIKSADIVNAYYEQINARLEGIYVAESDFGKYARQTSLDIEANSTSITNAFKSIEVIESDVAEINEGIRKTNAYIKTGELSNDGEYPVYGIEIGQENNNGTETVFKKYARFTSDKLSFYDVNNIEVAYISDYKLFITNAEVTGTLKLGGYQISTTDGLAFKWVGRGSE